MKNLSSRSCRKYLKNGRLTKPFLDEQALKTAVLKDFLAKEKSGEPMAKSIVRYIHSCVKPDQEQKLNKLKFMRTAKQIWSSKVSTGCTDYAYLYATFARQLGIPTTCLFVIEKNYLTKLVMNENDRLMIGHTFCESFYDGKWHLVDPTSNKITDNYDINEIDLNYLIYKSSVFIPYKRCLDDGKKMGINEYVEQTKQLCLGLKGWRNDA